MKVETQEKTEVKTTVTHRAILEFDMMLVSPKRYYDLLVSAVMEGIDVKFKLEKSNLPDDVAVLKLGDKLVATVQLED